MTLPFMLDDAAPIRRSSRRSRQGLDRPARQSRRAKVYLFSGGSDAFVGSATVETARDLYLALGVPPANIAFVDHDGPAGHAGQPG